MLPRVYSNEVVLHKLNLFSLEYNRLRHNPIAVHKIIRGMIRLVSQNLTPRAGKSRAGGPELKVR